MTIQHVRVAGTSYQRGRQYGQQAADRVRRSVRGQTIASLLMDLTAGQLWLAAGNPCQVPYEQLTVKL